MINDDAAVWVTKEQIEAKFGTFLARMREFDKIWQAADLERMAEARKASPDGRLPASYRSVTCWLGSFFYRGVFEQDASITKVLGIISKSADGRALIGSRLLSEINFETPFDDAFFDRLEERFKKDLADHDQYVETERLRAENAIADRRGVTYPPAIIEPDESRPSGEAVWIFLGVCALVVVGLWAFFDGI